MDDVVGITQADGDALFMIASSIQIPPEFERLSRAEKLAFISALVDQVEPFDESNVALTAEQQAEIQRRLARFDADPTIAEPWEDVRAELLAD